jgi:hypothetical protein
LLGDNETIFFVTDNDRFGNPLRANIAIKPQGGGLDQRFLTVQGLQLFWILLA